MSRPRIENPDGFPTTNWSVVRDTGAERSEHKRALWGELRDRYWPALWAHLVYRKRLSAHEAEDLIQSFIEKKVLQNNLVQIADPARGKFRTVLLTALDRFLIDSRRKKSAVAPTARMPI